MMRTTMVVARRFITVGGLSYERRPARPVCPIHRLPMRVGKTERWRRRYYCPACRAERAGKRV